MQSKTKNIFKTISIVLLGLILKACGGNAENLKEGMLAPDFSLQNKDGVNYTLSSYRGKEPVVVYFYPKANTPGCTKQACSIRDNSSSIEKTGFTVLGISVDSKEDIKKFNDEYKLNFPLLSDNEKTVSKSYGVLNKIGIDSRITFIVDKEGKIAKIIRDVDVSTHTDQIIAEVKKISGI